MADRNEDKAARLEATLKVKFPNANISRIKIDMSDFSSVKSACKSLEDKNIDYVIHNAGAYKIPLKALENGYLNIFNINFVSPYYITKTLLTNAKHFVLVSSIANYYSKVDINDIDFSTRLASSLIYGNAKRFSMYAHIELFKNHPENKLSITHPGITLTGITDHYPKWLFPIMKPVMRIIFMKPKTAALSILSGLFEETKPYTWIGPRFFNIWGKPKLQKIKKASDSEINFIYQKAEEIYEEIK